MKTKNQKRFCLWAVVAVATIILARLTMNYVILIAAILPVGMLMVYGIRLDNENGIGNTKNGNDNGNSES